MRVFFNFPLLALLATICLVSNAYGQDILDAEDRIRSIEVEYVPGREPTTEKAYFESQLNAAISMNLIKDPEARQMAATRMGIPLENINLRNITLRQSNFEATPILVSGTQSSILLRFNIQNDPITPVLRDVMTRAAEAWVEVFPIPTGTGPIVVNIFYDDLGSNQLGGASATTLAGSCHLDQASTNIVQDNSWWSAATVLSTTGSRPGNIADDDFSDISLTMNSQFPSWYTGISPTIPAGEVDMLSTAIHEIGHGLFFTSRKRYDAATGKGGFKYFGNTLRTRFPSRYDQFLRVFDSTTTPQTDLGTLASRCNAYTEFGNALVGAGGLTLRFFHASENADFTLYTPSTFAPGSSVSHLAEVSSVVQSDCAAVGIPATDCSELMTPVRAYGEGQRNIGENTKRIMRSILDTASRNVGGKCTSDLFNISPV